MYSFMGIKFCAGAYLRITKEVTRGEEKPQIFQFQVKAGKPIEAISTQVTKTEDSALTSLKEKVSAKQDACF